MNQNNIYLNDPANNNFIYSRNKSIDNRNNNININNYQNNNRYNNNTLIIINNRNNNRQNTNNNINNININNINNKMINIRTHIRNSDRINTENNRSNDRNNILNGILNYSFESNSNRNNILNDILNYSFESNNNRNNNGNNSRNKIENGNEYFIPAFRQAHSIVNNNRSRLFRRNVNGSVEPRPRKIASSFKKNLLKNIPEIIIKDFTKLEEGKKSCIICFEDFNPKIKVKALPCLHFFHPACIEKWIKQFCPICKFCLTEKNLREKNDLLTS